MDMSRRALAPLIIFLGTKTRKGKGGMSVPRSSKREVVKRQIRFFFTLKKVFIGSHSVPHINWTDLVTVLLQSSLVSCISVYYRTQHKISSCSYTSSGSSSKWLVYTPVKSLLAFSIFHKQNINQRINISGSVLSFYLKFTCLLSWHQDSRVHWRHIVSSKEQHWPPSVFVL